MVSRVVFPVALSKGAHNAVNFLRLARELEPTIGEEMPQPDRGYKNIGEMSVAALVDQPIARHKILLLTLLLLSCHRMRLHEHS